MDTDIINNDFFVKELREKISKLSQKYQKELYDPYYPFEFQDWK